jgi:hypothetical protein
LEPSGDVGAALNLPTYCDIFRIPIIADLIPCL